MTTLQGIDMLVNWFAQTKCVYFKAYDSDTKSKRQLFTNFESEDKPTPEDAIRALRSFVSMWSQNGLRCYIWAVNATNNPSGGFYTWFEQPPMSGGSNQNPVIQGIPEGYVKADDIESRINAALDRYKTEEKIKALEAENALLKKEAYQETAVDRVIGRIEPYVPTIMKSWFGATVTPSAASSHVPVSGNFDKTETQSAEDSMIESLEVLSENYPNLPEILKKLAEKPKDELEPLLKFL